MLAPTLFNLLMLVLMGGLSPVRNDGLRIEISPSGGTAPSVSVTGPEGFTSYQEPIDLPRDTQGCDRREIHGQPCADGYTRAFNTATMNGSGICIVEGWASDDPTDCRVWVRVAEAPGQSGTCVVTVYEAPKP